MILFSIVFAYLMLSIIVGLMGKTDERYKTKMEQERQRRELREALRQTARMKE